MILDAEFYQRLNYNLKNNIIKTKNYFLIKYLVFFYTYLMISPNDIQVTKTDLTLFATVLVVSNLVEGQLLKSQLFNEKWMNLAVATLLGVALHGLLTNKISSVINSQLNINNAGVKASIYDLIKFGTVFASQRAIVSYIDGKEIVFDEKWLMSSGAVIAGYAAFNTGVQQMVPTISSEYQPLLNDLIKVSMGALASNYLMDGTINQTHLMLLAATLSGFTAFHLGTKNVVVPKEKFASVGGHSICPQ